jgi:hypothetical protein
MRLSEEQLSIALRLTLASSLTAARGRLGANAKRDGGAAAAEA